MNKTLRFQVNSKKELLLLQRTFAEIIRKPLLKGDRMKADLRAKSLMLPNDKLSEHERLELYAQQYWWRITRSFDDDFRSLKKLLGEKKYKQLRDSYLYKLPSRSFTLRDLGSRLPSFIKSYSKLTKNEKIAAFECASFEWGKIESYDSKEFSPLSPEDVTSHGFEKKKLFLQPHIKLFTFNYPIHKLIRDLKNVSYGMSSNVERLDRSKRSKVSQGTKLKQEKTYLVIHRYENSVRMKCVSESQIKILNLFVKGCSLEKIDKFTKIFKNVDDDELYSMFRDWISLKWLCLGE